MDHEHCKQHPRPKLATGFARVGHGDHPCPAEPKMDDLTWRLRRPRAVASTFAGRL